MDRQSGAIAQHALACWANVVSLRNVIGWVRERRIARHRDFERQIDPPPV